MGAGKANESEPLMTRRDPHTTMSKPRKAKSSREEPGGHPAYCPGGIRRIGGASPVQAPVWNVGSCDPDTARLGESPERSEREKPKRGTARVRVPMRGMQWRTASW